MSAISGAGAPRWDGWSILLGLLALGTLANGVWMLLDPARWYTDLPAGVPDTGPLNEHFVRDIGCAFLTAGGALLWGALRPRVRPVAVTLAAVFFVLHALLHVWDTAWGGLGGHHWWLDLPGVYLPALILLVASAHFLRSERAAH